MRIKYSNGKVVLAKRYGFVFPVSGVLYSLIFFSFFVKSPSAMADISSNYVVVSCSKNSNSVKIQPVFIFSGENLPVGAISTKNISHFTDKSPATKICLLNKDTSISIKVGENPNSSRNDNVKIFVNNNILDGFFGFVSIHDMKNKYILIESKSSGESPKIYDCLSSEICKSASTAQ